VTPEQLTVLIILFGALVVFASDRLRVDVVSLLVLLVLLITGLVTAEEAFMGFSSPAVVTVGAVFVVSEGLVRTGVADKLADIMLRLTGPSPVRINAVVMLTCGILSAVMNNIGAAAILLPAVLTIARKTNVSPSKMLIQLAFASLMGGNMTAIGTPPNILANSLLQSYGEVAPFGFFAFTPTGIIILVTGVLYFVVVGTRLLPERAEAVSLTEAYPQREYIVMVRVAPTSQALGQTIKDVKLGERHDIKVLAIRRMINNYTLFPDSSSQLRGGDRIILQGDPIVVEQVIKRYDWEIEAVHQQAYVEEELAKGSIRIIEVALAPSSPLLGQTLEQIRFRNRYGLSVLSIRHQKWSTTRNLDSVPLQFGDSLLLSGPEERIDVLRLDPNFVPFEQPSREARRTGKSPFAIGILLGVLVIATTGILPISAAMLIGAILMVLTRTITIDEAYQGIDWKAVFLIAGMLPLGVAMQDTGTAVLLADNIISVVGRLGPVGVMMGIYFLTAMLTTAMSNAAVTVLVVPIAIDAARGLGVSPYTFVMAVVIAASTSYLMPIGHQVNVLVYGPGEYRFTDYVKVGAGLSLVIAILVAIMVPLFWPL